MASNLIPLPALWNGNRERRNSSSQDYQTAAVPTLSSREIAPSLYSLIESMGPFPPYSVVVGQCRDGLPLMIDLDNPKSGSILVVGENVYEKTQIMKTLGHSASLINKPGLVQISLISNNISRYSDLEQYPNCHAWHHAYDRAAAEMIIELASLAEQRRWGRETGRAMMLLIDDFQSLAPILSDDRIYLSFKTLVSRGPTSGIWPILSINPGDERSDQGQLLHSFGTYIFEKVSRDLSSAGNSNNARQAGLSYPPNYNVIIGGRLIPISVLSV